MTGTEIRKYADIAMFDAEPQEVWDPETGVVPKVHIITMTRDPLGVMAAMNGIYRGVVHKSTVTVTDDEREGALSDMMKTHLTAPLESINIHFLLEGVDRAFTHQLVRQRTANYGQESMRFAVLGNLLESTTLPPSLVGTDGLKNDRRRMWNDTIEIIDRAYHWLVADGMPAEEARGLLPTCTATRIHYQTKLRGLTDHAGNRLCTQAQFHWRSVFSQIVSAMPEWAEREDPENVWQYHKIAESNLFRPVCWAKGGCAFKGSADRHCSIRDKVDELEQDGVPSTQWDSEIPVELWLHDHTSARKAEEGLAGA